MSNMRLEIVFKFFFAFLQYAKAYFLLRMLLVWIRKNQFFYLQFSSNVTESKTHSQFHQHFTCKFFVLTLFWQLFTCYMYVEEAAKTTFVQKMLMKLTPSVDFIQAKHFASKYQSILRPQKVAFK